MAAYRLQWLVCLMANDFSVSCKGPRSRHKSETQADRPLSTAASEMNSCIRNDSNADV